MEKVPWSAPLAFVLSSSASVCVACLFVCLHVCSLDWRVIVNNNDNENESERTTLDGGVLNFKFCIGEACCARRSNPRVNVNKLSSLVTDPTFSVAILAL